MPAAQAIGVAMSQVRKSVQYLRRVEVMDRF
jgi:hypothetical protein